MKYENLKVSCWLEGSKMARGYIIRRNMPIHDLDNLCVYGQRLLDANDPNSFASFDTFEQAKASGGHACKECVRIRDRRRQEGMFL